VENMECGKHGVWKTRSVENAECLGKHGVFYNNTFNYALAIRQ
jgi:hypothetical protein